MKYYMTILFWFMFISYTALAVMGADGRPLEFFMGVLLFGMLDEIYHAEKAKKKVKKK